MRVVEKTPAEILFRSFNWAAWLGSDTLLVSSMIIGAGLTVVSEANDTTSARVFLSGGSVGAKIYVTNRVTTVGGRVAERTLQIKMVEYKTK